MSRAESDGVEIRVEQCVRNALEELNALRAADDRMVLSPDLQLLGDGGGLDSLAFVNFVVSLDTALAAEFGADASVMGDLLAAPDPAEFSTVATLSKYVARRVAAASE